MPMAQCPTWSLTLPQTNEMAKVMMTFPRDTLVVEFQLSTHVNYAMWELSPLLEQNYWVLVYENHWGDMKVDVQEVVKVRV